MTGEDANMLRDGKRMKSNLHSRKMQCVKQSVTWTLHDWVQIVNPPTTLHFSNNPAVLTRVNLNNDINKTYNYNYWCIQKNSQTNKHLPGTLWVTPPCVMVATSVWMLIFAVPDLFPILMFCAIPVTKCKVQTYFCFTNCVL